MTIMTHEHFDNLLQTKIFTPPLREDYVPRTRLIDRLNNAEPTQSIFVKSPAGYGKTTLIVEWLAQLEIPHAWYAVDRRDNDLSQFLTYIVYALNQVKPGICEKVLPVIHSPDPPPVKRLMDYLINCLTHFQERVVLVIDDLHLIASKEIHDGLNYLLQHHPPQVQLVLVSREDLPFPTSTLRARNQLLEFDLFDLRFTVKEADEFLKKAFDIQLPFDKVVKLDNHVEGWVTGLQLAALSLRKRQDKETYLAQITGEDQLIQSFLFEEVIANQPHEIQQFLHRTSILDRLSAPLCNYVLEIDNSQDILERLDRLNLFIIPLDNRQERYRYHHLFAEALQNRLEQADPELASDLYQRAFRWHRQRGELEEAIEYAIQAEDYESAGDLIESIVNRVILDGGRRRILRWLSAFTPETLRKKVPLWSHLITAHLGLGEFEKARQSLEELWGNPEHFAGFSDREQRMIRSLNAGFLSSIEIHTTLNARKVRGLAEQAMALFPEDIKFGRSIGPGYFAVACYHLGRLQEGKTYIDQAIQLSKRHEYSRLELLWRCYRAQMVLDSGALNAANEVLQEVDSMARNMGVHESNVVSNVIIAHGHLQFEWNNLEKAEKFFVDGLEIAKSANFLDHVIWGLEYYLRYLTAVGEFDQAREELHLAMEIASRMGPPPVIVDHLQALNACVDIKEGRLEEAQEWAAEVGDWQEEEFLGRMAFKWLTLARTWLFAGEVKKGLPLLQALVDDSHDHQRGRDYVESSVVLAQAYVLIDETPTAKEVLLKALEFAQPQRYVRSFLEGGQVIWELLQTLYIEEDQAYRDAFSVEKKYVRQLLSAFEVEQKRMEGLGLDIGCSPGEELLTRREGEILTLLAQGLSYAEIGSTLSITENTVKTHIKNLYRKLQANNRTEAVNRARSLNIL